MYICEKCPLGKTEDLLWPVFLTPKPVQCPKPRSYKLLMYVSTRLTVSTRQSEMFLFSIPIKALGQVQTQVLGWGQSKR